MERIGITSTKVDYVTAFTGLAQNRAEALPTLNQLWAEKNR
jgi:hypothetical protein